MGSIRDAVLPGTGRAKAGNSAPLHTYVPGSSRYVEGADCQADAGCLFEPLHPIFLNRSIGKLSYTNRLYFLWSSACSDYF
jgi:hypothetical protein